MLFIDRSVQDLKIVNPVISFAVVRLITNRIDLHIFKTGNPTKQHDKPTLKSTGLSQEFRLYDLWHSCAARFCQMA